MNDDRLLAALVGGFLVYLWLNHEYQNGTWPTGTMRSNSYSATGAAIGNAVGGVLDAAGYPVNPASGGSCQ